MNSPDSHDDARVSRWADEIGALKRSTLDRCLDDGATRGKTNG
jgi:hypothetical protein